MDKLDPIDPDYAKKSADFLRQAADLTGNSLGLTPELVKELMGPSGTLFERDFDALKKAPEK